MTYLIEASNIILLLVLSRHCLIKLRIKSKTWKDSIKVIESGKITKSSFFKEKLNR